MNLPWGLTSKRSFIEVPSMEIRDLSEPFVVFPGGCVFVVFAHLRRPMAEIYRASIV